jgi:hypothetical protein
MNRDWFNAQPRLRDSERLRIHGRVQPMQENLPMFPQWVFPLMLGVVICGVIALVIA